jgi:hypothetical protein
MVRMRHLTGLVLAMLVIAACAPPAAVPPSPAGSAVVTFRVSDQTFRVQLTTKEQVEAAKAAKAGGAARIPNGRIASGTEVNLGWSWHLVDVTFAEVTTEVCDGRPSDVEQAGVNFGAGRFCPWTAEIVGIGGP